MSAGPHDHGGALTLEQFAIALAATRLSDKSGQAAALVLVHRKTQAEAARLQQIARQQVWTAVRSIKRALTRGGKCGICGATITKRKRPAGGGKP